MAISSKPMGQYRRSIIVAVHGAVFRCSRSTLTDALVLQGRTDLDSSADAGDGPLQGVRLSTTCGRVLYSLTAFNEIPKLKNSNNGDIVKNTEQGTISFQFKNGISVDITLDGSIRVANQTANAVAAVNATGNISAVMHPVGFMYKKDEIVHVQANDINFGNHKLAKIRSTGIHFKAVKSPLVYLVDEAGVRTNFSENFMRMDRDITLDVLYKDCRHGAMYVNVCNDLLSDIKSTVLETGTEWKLYDVSVVQENVHGFIRVIKDGCEKFEIRSSASVGTINLYSDAVDCTASHGTNHHLFVKKNKSRIHYEVRNKFMVRYGGYHTGFNECDEVSFF